MSCRLTDSFWTPRQEANARRTLPHIYRMCEETGQLSAFRLQWKPGQANAPHIFWDSDVAKWLEAACDSLALRPDRRLREQVEETVRLIVGAQQPDGYLNTHFTVVEPDNRWTNLRDKHELYCAGHLIEAAVAHHKLTGDRTLLNAVRRYADHIDARFGAGESKRRGYCGHPEIELALVRLHHATGEKRWMDLASYFVDERGRQPHYFDQEARERGEDPAAYWAKTYAYCQAHRPVRQQKEIGGHAVRALYLLCAMADLARLTGDRELRAACRGQWKDVTLSKMYVTGGVGPSARNEGFTTRYDLPNEGAYAETCASIALIMFARRMLLIEPDGVYADVMERALYNSFLAGIGLDGRSFFYVNPLASAGGHERLPWFDCACCPPNIARVIAGLGDYVYSATESAVHVHLYAGSTASFAVGGGQLTIRQDTRYPWDGAVRLTLDLSAPARFDLACRIPGWCRAHTAEVNGKAVDAAAARGYLHLRRTWHDGDEVVLSFPMPAERVTANPRVAEDAGRVALQRGPLVYCVEECDLGSDARTMVLPADAPLRIRHAADLLGGVTVIEGPCRVPLTDSWEGALYRQADSGAKRRADRAARFRAIPYCAWANRKPGTMAVWLRSSG